MDKYGAGVNGAQPRVPVGSRNSVLAFLRAVLVAERVGPVARRRRLLEHAQEHGVLLREAKLQHEHEGV